LLATQRRLLGEEPSCSSQTDGDTLNKNSLLDQELFPSFVAAAAFGSVKVAEDHEMHASNYLGMEVALVPIHPGGYCHGHE
jgi:hypothetical protein